MWRFSSLGCPPRSKRASNVSTDVLYVVLHVVSFADEEERAVLLIVNPSRTCTAARV